MRTKFTLRDWLFIKQMSVDQLAKKSGVTSRTIRRYLASDKNIGGAFYPNLSSIAKSLGIKVEDMYIDPDVDVKKSLSDTLNKIKGDDYDGKSK